MSDLPAERATILVADDDPSVCLAISKTLHRNGFTVISADSGERAIGLVAARKGAIDLAIIDMQMPGMNGLDLAVEVARAYPSMSILYISGNHESIALDCISRHAPESVLFKPFSFEALLQKVSGLLGTHLEQTNGAA
jgi:CheY-like chemotaxis protein